MKIILRLDSLQKVMGSPSKFGNVVSGDIIKKKKKKKQGCVQMPQLVIILIILLLNSLNVTGQKTDRYGSPDRSAAKQPHTQQNCDTLYVQTSFYQNLH